MLTRDSLLMHGLVIWNGIHFKYVHYMYVQENRSDIAYDTTFVIEVTGSSLQGVLTFPIKKSHQAGNQGMIKIC